MLDDVYKNAFKEVYEILRNTGEELIKKVPQKFISFIQSNMNNDYETSINTQVPINEQSILSETEDILSLIYRSWWATDEEKREFANRDKQYLMEIEEYKKCERKGIEDIFQKKRSLDNVTVNNNLVVIEKQNSFARFFKRVLSVFQNKRQGNK